jgi:hypothetical protein
MADNDWLYNNGLEQSAKDMSVWASLIDDPIVLPPVNAQPIPNNAQPLTPADQWIDTQPQPTYNTVSFGIRVVKKGKLSLYDIVIPGTKLCILSNIFDKRAAEYIITRLNSGKTIADKSILGIVVICMEMSKIISDTEIETIKRSQVLNDRDYEQARLCDDAINKLHESASTLKAKLNKYIV